MQREMVLIWFEGLKIEFSPVDTEKHTHKNKNTEHTLCILCGRGIASAMILTRWICADPCSLKKRYYLEKQLSNGYI